MGPRDQTWNIRLGRKWLYPWTILWGSAYKFLISTFYAPSNISVGFLYLLGQQTQETFYFREFYYKRKIRRLASFPSFFTSFLYPLSFVYSANVLVTSFCSYPFPIFFTSITTHWFSLLLLCSRYISLASFRQCNDLPIFYLLSIIIWTILLTIEAYNLIVAWCWDFTYLFYHSPGKQTYSPSCYSLWFDIYSSYLQSL